MFVEFLITSAVTSLSCGYKFTLNLMITPVNNIEVKIKRTTSFCIRTDLLGNVDGFRLRSKAEIAKSIPKCTTIQVKITSIILY